MKKVFAVFLVVLSLFMTHMIPAKAESVFYEMELRMREDKETPEASGDDTYVQNTFFHFADSLADVSFADVRQYLVDQGYSFRETIGENEFATFHVECPVSEVYFCFYPLDTSTTSTAFGDPDREMLSCIEYSRGDKWITVTDEFHTKTVHLIAGNKNDDPVKHEISETDLLRIFYNYEIGGNISADDIVGAEMTSDSERLSAIRGTVSSRIKEYTRTTISDVVANQDVSTTDPDDFILQVFLKWDVKNGTDNTKKMIEMYGDDMAVTLGETYSDAKEIYIFWYVPFLVEKGTAAKFEYKNVSNGVLIIDRTGPLYY